MRFLTGWLRTLAAFMRRAVSLLEGMSSPEPVNAAMMDLSARYPGAPDHWLQYIAAHTPRSPEIEDLSAPVQPPKKALLDFSSSEKSRKPVSLKFFGNQPQQVAKISFPDRPAKSPPRPHFIPADNGGVKTAPLRLQPDVANDVRPPAANGNDKIAAAVSKRKPSLHLIRKEETHAGNLPPEEHAARPTQKPASEIRWKQHSSIARFVQLIGLGKTPVPDIRDDIEWHHDAQAKQPMEHRELPPKRPVESGMVSAERLSARPLPAELFVAPVAERFPHALEFPQQASRIPEMPYFGHAKPPVTNPEFPVEHFDRRWPALPPVVETIHDAPIEPPRLSRLAREQEEGLWNA